MTPEYVASYQWWSEFLFARGVAIEAMRIEGRSYEEIAQTLSCETTQCRLINERERS